MKLRSISPDTIVDTPIYDYIQDSIGPRIQENYILMIEAQNIAPEIYQQVEKSVQEIVEANSTISANDFLTILEAQFPAISKNRYITNRLLDTIEIAEDMVQLCTNFESFIEKVLKLFDNALTDFRPINSKVKKLENTDNLIVDVYETQLSYLTNELEKLFPIVASSDPNRKVKLLSILYHSYVVDTSLYQDASYEVNGRKIKIDFKHIEQLKFIKELLATDISSMNQKELLLSMPIEDVDLDACKAIEWMPELIEYIKESKPSTSKLNAQLAEIDTTCQEYANQFITWMILAISDGIEQEQQSSAMLMPFGDLLFGVEHLAELRPATPIQEYTEDINHPCNLHIKVMA